MLKSIPNAPGLLHSGLSKIIYTLSIECDYSHLTELVPD